ncbi:Transcriptional regulator, LysR family [Labilithrix luteola]|uniref:Transcriptional regulator, LysR family n=1 Tax=Labilithrix luteola TaxID=1391654 RepID=A0A0K1Q3Z4_9BACT|nr:LysR family transcriptional regulator [Labilithrix luteola]AKV00556.1 Transcriptional regulator, LysR family [Labilithrix luteola]
MDGFNDLNAFVQAAMTRSFVEAGRRLGISASAVGKTIARLEQHFGARLFHRTTRSISLTEDGARLLVRCERILAELEGAEHDFARGEDTPRGRLRIALPMASPFFSPLLADFSRIYPHVELDVEFSDTLVDVVRDGFDVVIRTGAAPDSRLSSRKLAPFRHVVVGAPRYFAEQPVPSSPSELNAHRLLFYRKPHTGKLEPWPFASDVLPASFGARGSLVVNSIDALVVMTIEGRGLSSIPDYLIENELRDGRLIRTLDSHIVGANAFRLLWPPTTHLPPKVRAFIDFFTTKLSPKPTRRTRR